MRVLFRSWPLGRSAGFDDRIDERGYTGQGLQPIDRFDDLSRVAAAELLQLGNGDLPPARLARRIDAVQQLGRAVFETQLDLLLADGESAFAIAGLHDDPAGQIDDVGVTPSARNHRYRKSVVEGNRW